MARGTTRARTQEYADRCQTRLTAINGKAENGFAYDL